MRLMSKNDMLHQQWKTFEHYPKQGSTVILHIRGYRVRENIYCHDFITISKFNALSFDKRDFTPNLGSFIKWDFSWLPQKTLMINQ